MFTTDDRDLLATEELQLLPTPKRIRVRFGGEWVADSQEAALLREKGHLPVYYLPKRDVRMEMLQSSEHTTHCERKGEAVYWTVTAGGRSAENAAWAYAEPIADARRLADYLAFDWTAMDAWFEEDEEVDVHPRDPFHRIDTRRSSRHLEVELNGVKVAETRRPTLLFETGLATRFYIPATDVRLDLLDPSDRTSGCPYKGHAGYYNVRAGDRLVRDVVWTYPIPRPAAQDIAGMLCFYSERLDALYVDGEKLASPPVF